MAALIAFVDLKHVLSHVDSYGRNLNGGRRRRFDVINQYIHSGTSVANRVGASLPLINARLDYLHH